MILSVSSPAIRHTMTKRLRRRTDAALNFPPRGRTWIGRIILVCGAPSREVSGVGAHRVFAHICATGSTLLFLSTANFRHRRRRRRSSGDIREQSKDVEGRFALARSSDPQRAGSSSSSSSSCSVALSVRVQFLPFTVSERRR